MSVGDSDAAAANHGVLLEDVGFAHSGAQATPTGANNSTGDENTQFATLQRAMRNEASAVDLNDDYDSNVALFVYAGAHQTPPDAADPVAQVMQSADKQYWYVFNNNVDEAESRASERDCRAPLIHFDAGDMPVCHRRIERDAIGEAIYLALWLAAQSAPDAEQLSAFATGYKVFHDERETPEASVLAGAVLNSAQVLQGEDAQKDESTDQAAKNGDKGSEQSKVPGPASRAWMLWVIGGTVLLLVAAITIYFVALKKRAQATQSAAGAVREPKKMLTTTKRDEMQSLQADDDFARSAADSREAAPLFGNV